MPTTTLPALDGLAIALRMEAERQSMLHNKDAERLYRHWADAVELLEAALGVPAQQGARCAHLQPDGNCKQALLGRSCDFPTCQTAPPGTAAPSGGVTDAIKKEAE
jgi:hypothetical protein